MIKRSFKAILAGLVCCTCLIGFSGCGDSATADNSKSTSSESDSDIDSDSNDENYDTKTDDSDENTDDYDTDASYDDSDDYDSDDTYDSDNNNGVYNPNGSDYTDINGNHWHKNRYDGNYYSDNGYSVYKRSDGATEITDGYGNWAADTDGDGQLDQYGSDNY